MNDTNYEHITDSSAPHLHPGDRLIVAEEAIPVLEIWMENCWKNDEVERFCMIGDLLTAIIFGETILW